MRLAEALNADKDELITLAGRIPADIAELLKNQKTLQLLRSERTRKKILAKKGEGFSLLTRVTRPKMPIFNYKNFARVAIALVLVIAVGASLWFASPTPVRALEINFPSLPSGNLGTSHSFSVNVTLGTQDLVPIQSVNITIYNLADPTKKATLASLPLNAGSKSYTSTETGDGGAASVTATTATGWAFVTDDGYAYWKGTGYSFGPATSGYGYSPGTGTTTITYSITWTSPSGWPAGNYKVEVDVDARSATLTKTFTENSSSFSLTRAAAPAAPVAGEPPPEPTTEDISDIIDEEGEFTEPVRVESEDENVTLFIPKGTTGLTEEDEPISEISITEVRTPPAPPEDSNFIGLNYDFEPSGATFDPEITLTFTYNPDWIPERVSPENLTIVYYDEDAGEWVTLDAEDIVVDPDTNTITAKISHFTYFSVIAITRPAAFTTSDLTITPTEVDIAQSVKISATITNTGDRSGSHEVTLKIKGKVVSTKKITLAGQASEKVTFTTVQGAPGTYTVNLDGLSGAFTVKPVPTVIVTAPPAPAPAPPAPAPAPAPPAPVPPPPLPAPVPEVNVWLLVIIAAVAIIVVGAVVWFFGFRREY
ncbi:hypothetical protein ES703_52661 [subsurface metagenome]